ncbi:MAG: rRNA maturation RNase YbeY [Bacteriovorax sp.]|nr:rRNA maturation RNase YbeY [Bacteriovorax sp.]
MKFSIFYQNSGLKKDTSKGMERVISALEAVLTSNLKKNPHFAGVKDVTLTMTLCGKTKIRKLNRDYRQKDYVTDVLSFPVYENLRPDKKPKGKNLVQMDLGDLVICKEKAFSQAKEFEITYEQEIVHLAVHGFLHLIGFDHEISAKEEKLMEAHENEIVGQVYIKLKAKK